MEEKLKLLSRLEDLTAAQDLVEESEPELLGGAIVEWRCLEGICLLRLLSWCPRPM